MSRLHFVDAVALSRAPDFGSIAACETLQTWLGLPQHLPFIIDDDGIPIRSVNSWLSQLHADGSLSSLTWKAYAQDWLDWYRFLDNRGIDPLSATGDHIKHYHSERRIGVPDLDRVLEATSWNRMVASLDSYYKWALQKKLIERVPFTYREVRIHTGQGGSAKVERNMAKEKGARQHATLKWLEKDYLRTFLDVGITGLLPTGEEDPTFRGQNTARNRAFAELLATAGLRVQEASHLLTTEIPEVPKNPVKFVRMELPASICKGQKARWVLVPPSTLRSLHSYMRLERGAPTTARTRSWIPDRPLTTVALDAHRSRIDGRTIHLSDITASQRRQLVSPQGTSPLLFLQSDGSPMLEWERVFANASTRCRRYDSWFPWVTPHTLRHTFAIHMLHWLIEQVAQAVVLRQETADIVILGGYWRVHDPLTTVRDLLGHASVVTTQIYLHAIDATRLYANIMDEEEASNEGKGNPHG